MAAAIENIMVTQAVTKLEEIFRAHQVCVLKAAYRVTGSMADAEDVSQSVFLRLARGTFDSGRQLALNLADHRTQRLRCVRSPRRVVVIGAHHEQRR